MPEVFVSTDVEADGPIPGPNSMLSFASAAFNEAGVMVGTFSRNLRLLEGATPDPATTTWWGKHPEAYEATRKDQVLPETAMREYAKWVGDLSGSPVFVAYPAGYDFTWVYWYLMRFAGFSPFSFSAIDIKTYAMAMLGGPFRGMTKREMPKRWFGPGRHTHVALDDAIEQGDLFMNMRRERLAQLAAQTVAVRAGLDDGGGA